MNSTIERSAYERIAKLLCGVVQNEWLSLCLKAPVLGANLGGTTSTKVLPNGKEEDLPLGWKLFDIQDLVVELRDHIQQTTGQRIWGLTFTLYPDGKFNVEYDYNKPADYEEEPAHQPFLDQCMDELRSKSAAATEAWGLGHEERWNLDLNAGELHFDFAQGRKVTVPIQVVGTYDIKTASFLWGWDHPSVPEQLRRAAQRVREYGEQQGIEPFTQRNVHCSEDEAWEFTAAAVHLDGATAAYRGPSGSTLVFMALGEPALS